MASPSPRPPKPEHMQPALTSTINESDLTYYEQVGRGATADVFRATWDSQEYGKIEVAAKKIHIFKGESIESKIGGELNYLQALNHKDVIKYYGHVVTPAYVVIITEYAAQGSLYDYLKDKPSLSKEQKKKWMIQAAESIRFLAQNNIVHRDIKSPNFLITADGDLKLCDFGIAKDLTSTKTTAGSKGTVKWLAPEVFTEQKLSPKADIFALGVVFWEMETCREPYEGKTQEHVMFRVGTDDLRPEIPEKCAPALRTLILQCWQKDRDKRPHVDGVVNRLRMIFKSRCHVVALYNCDKEDEDELSFIKDDIIKVVEKHDDDGWWSGSLRGAIGLFPSNYVKPVFTSLDGRVKALFPYEMNSKRDLEFQKDDVIDVIEKDNSGWWTGQLGSNLGFFPDNYVTPLITHSTSLKAAGRPQASNISTSSMIISWSPASSQTTSDDETPVIGYILEFKEESSNVWTTVNNLIYDTTYKIEGFNWMAVYHFRVFAVNASGQGPPSEISEGYQYEVGCWIEKSWIGSDVYAGGCIRGIVVCPNGNIAVVKEERVYKPSESTGCSIEIFNSAGERKADLVFKEVHSVQSVVVNSKGIFFLASTTHVNAIREHDGRGVLQYRFKPVTTDGQAVDGKSWRLGSLAFDNNGQLLVGVVEGDDIYVRHGYISTHLQDGKHVSSIKVNTAPDYLATTRHGTIVISDSDGGSNVIIVDQAGNCVHKIELEAPTSAPETCWGPYDIVCRKDTIFVSQYLTGCLNLPANNGVIYCFSLEGQYIGCILGKNLQAMEKIAVSEDGNMLVAQQVYHEGCTSTIINMIRK